MRRLFLAALLAAIPFAPAQAGPVPAACVVTVNVPACAGTCTPGEPISVVAIGNGTGTATCGGATATCDTLRGRCGDTAVTTGSGPLNCSGSAPVVICEVGVAIT